MALADLRNIGKRFVQGDTHVDALRQIDLKIERGDFVAIMGPSGSGKSTLLYILGCLDTPSGGEYLIDGQDVAKLDDNELSHIRSRYIGFVFQSFYLIPYLTVLENVLIPMIYSTDRQSQAEAEKILQKLGLGERMGFSPDQLSGGEKQRAAIARALINHPEMILADEPTGQLDSKSAQGVMEILSQLNREGKTVIIVTHDPGIASYAKKTVRMEDGKIVS